MPDKKKSIANVRRAQAAFEREQDKLRETRAKSRAKRREAFTQAQRAGLSLREIGEAVGMHRSRVAEIISGE